MHFENVNFEDYFPVCFYFITACAFISLLCIILARVTAFGNNKNLEYMVHGLFRCLSIEYLISNEGISVLDTFQHSYKLPGPIDKLFKSLDFK